MDMAWFDGNSRKLKRRFAHLRVLVVAVACLPCELTSGETAADQRADCES